MFHSGSFKVLNGGLASGMISLSIPYLQRISAWIGFLSFDVYSSDILLLRASLLNSRLEECSLNTTVHFKFSKGDVAATEFAKLYKTVQKADSMIYIKNIQFGANEKLTFEGLSLVYAPLPISHALTSEKKKSSEIKIFDSDWSASVELVPSGIQSEIRLKFSTIQLSISVGYISASLFHENELFASLEVQDVDICGNAMKVNMNVGKNMPRFAQYSIKRLISQNSLKLEFSGFLLGPSAKDRIELFSKIVSIVDVPLDSMNGTDKSLQKEYFGFERKQSNWLKIEYLVTSYLPLTLFPINIRW
jgi:hypothetical protein